MAIFGREFIRKKRSFAILLILVCSNIALVIVGALRASADIPKPLKVVVILLQALLLLVLDFLVSFSMCFKPKKPDSKSEEQPKEPDSKSEEQPKEPDSKRKEPGAVYVIFNQFNNSTVYFSTNPGEIV